MAVASSPADALRNFSSLLTSLQYPIDTPANPDSFQDSPHYAVGKLDFVTIAVLIAVLGILRDVLRIFVFEPLARWKLTRDLCEWHHNKRVAAAKANGGPSNGKANGHSNGHANGHVNGNGTANGLPRELHNPSKKELKTIQRSVMRFAEQGWFVTYYALSWSYGLVRYLNFNLFYGTNEKFAVRPSPSSNKLQRSQIAVDRLSTSPLGRTHQILLPVPNCILYPSNARAQCRSPTKRPLADDGSPCHHYRPTRS